MSHPSIPPQALLGCHSTQFCACLPPLEMVSEAWSSPLSLPCRVCAPREGIQSLGSSLGLQRNWSECWTNPCDSFSLNYNNLYPGQFLLCVFFLSTQQGVTELSHLPTLSSHFLRDNIPKSRHTRHLLLDNILKLPQNNS